MSKMLNNVQLADFCSNMASMISAGISTEEALNIIHDSNQDEELNKTVSLMLEQMKNGDSFALAVENSNAFPEYFTETIQLSALSGRYEESFMELSDYYTKEQEIQQTIKEIIAKPLTFFAILAVIMVFLIFAVLPVFEKVYQYLAGYSTFYITFAYGLAITVLVLITLVLGIVGILYVSRSSSWCQKLLNKMAEKSFLTRKATLTLARYQFFSMFNIMICGGSGQNIAMEKAAEAVKHTYLKAEIEKTIKLLDEGEEIGYAFNQNHVLTPTHTHLLLTASRNGQTEEAINSITDSLAEETVSDINHIIYQLEPVITISFTLSIGLALLSVMLPLISILAR